MRERAINLRDWEVRAILEGRKTQTRRPVQSPAFGAPGDLLWVRECWAQHESITIYRANEAELLPSWMKWTPSIHMPRWASRLTLRVTDVRVERVQDITPEDARAEGFDGDCPVGYLPAYQAGPCRYHFASSWSDTYGAESWTANPWVWCVSFERAEVPR